ncbi:MAG: DUF3800 domain-containing protein [Burkholderiales bacterium]|jgi:hypothetical protein|nr:DUF3800 domain-containing protein [Burkholderiales bacterium]
MNTQQFSDYIVYVDESGDHSLGNINKEYPVFVLAFCIFKKSDYLQVIQQITDFKFKYFGHDKVVLHESDIRRKREDFNIFNRESQAEFMNDYWQIIDNAKFTVISCVIDKLKHKEKYEIPDNPYELSMRVCIGKFRDFLKDNGVDSSVLNHIIVEKRGKNEDDDLELEFRRICEDKRYNLKLRMASKQTNCAGLQIADLIARPIGLKIMRPEQANRGFEIVAKKLRTGMSGSYLDYGLKILP